MIEVLFAVFSFLLTVIIVVGVHEYGHYWAARSCGVRVLKFSIGFGKPVWSHIDGNGTKWQVAPVPLGGFVQMVNDPKDAAEHGVPPEQSLEGIALHKRAWVVFAGPLANFVLAVALLFLVGLLGETNLRARIGEVVEDSRAQLAGFAAGDDIVAVDGRQALLWSKVLEDLLASVGERDLSVTTISSNGARRELTLPTGSMSVSELDGGDLLGKIGLVPDTSFVTLELETVVPGSPAARAGLAQGDFVLAAAGRVVYSWAEFVEVIRASPGEPMEIIFLRGGEEMSVEAIPETVVDGDGGHGHLGVSPRFDQAIYESSLATQREGPLEAARNAIERTWTVVATTIRLVGLMFSGEVSTEHLSGPVGIANIASLAISSGFVIFLKFVAQLSVSLGLINLVPIPVLDGGHLLRYAIEAIIRRPLPHRILQAAGAFGVVCIIALMIFAIYNDLT